MIEITVGTPPQQLTVIADTGSNWFWVQGTECTVCGGNGFFNSTQSATFNQTTTNKTLSYGSGNVYGTKSQETVCLALDTNCTAGTITTDFETRCKEICVDQLNMVYITDQVGLDTLQSEGILGLAPTNMNDPEMDLFIEKAYEQGQIAEKVFSLSIGTDDQESLLTIGGYNLTRFATSNITWHALNPDYHWEVTISGFKVGTTEVPLSMNITIVDSGTSYIGLPQSEYMALYDLLSVDHSCWAITIGNAMIICTCSDDFSDYPDLILNLSGTEYSIPPASYLTSYGSICTIDVMYIPSLSNWVLGLNFF